MSLLVALVGRPNVGKSTLFNRLSGKKIALVHDQPGLTRDRRYGKAQLSDLEFELIDTPGLETDRPPKNKEDLEYGLWEQTEKAIDEATLIFFMIDGREGVTLYDKFLANLLRKKNKPCILIVNKAEGKGAYSTLNSAHALGLGSPLPLSAEHGEGLNLLYEVLQPLYDQLHTPEIKAEESPKPISIAIVGQPNVGKSSLINKIIGANRFLTGPTAGLTRDALSVDFEWKGHPLKLVDTAGLRRKAKVTDRVEKLSSAESKRAIQFAEAVFLVIDATAPLEKQDLTLASHVLEEGRILIIVINKMDLIKNVDAFHKEVRLQVEESLHQTLEAPMVFVSALNNKNISKIFDTLFEVYPLWEKRVSTSALNNWLEDTISQHPPPISQGRRIKIRYMTQIKTRPPTFVLFISQAVELPESYLRYLKNKLTKDFNFSGVPLRLIPRQGKNPYLANK